MPSSCLHLSLVAHCIHLIAVLRHVHLVADGQVLGTGGTQREVDLNALPRMPPESSTAETLRLQLPITDDLVLALPDGNFSAVGDILLNPHTLTVIEGTGGLTQLGEDGSINGSTWMLGSSGRLNNASLVLEPGKGHLGCNVLGGGVCWQLPEAGTIWCQV